MATTKLTSNRYNIEVHQGETFELRMTLKSANGALRDVVGYTAEMQIRPEYSSNTLTESLSTANSEISVNTSTSVVSLVLSADRTANINVDLADPSYPPKKKYVYDMNLIDADGAVSKILYGDFIVYGSVTR